MAAPVVHGAEPEMGGLWLGHGTCGNRPVTFTLTVRTVPEGFEAEGGGGLAAMRLTAPHATDDGTYRFEPKERIDPSDRSAPYQLELRWLHEAGVLYGSRIDTDGECHGLILERIKIVEEPENPDGLLFQVSETVNGATARVELAERLDVEACADWGRWIAERAEATEQRFSVSPALGDFAGMRRVLGRDPFQWTDDDVRRIGIVNAACVDKLRASVDLDHASLLEKIGRYTNFSPLSGRNWRSGLAAVLEAAYADRITVLRLLKKKIDAGVIGAGRVDRPETLGERRARLAAAPIEEPTGEWFGRIRCDGQSLRGEDLGYPVRVFLEESNGRVTGALEVAASQYAEGSATLEGMFDASTRQMTLSSSAWVPASAARRAGTFQIDAIFEPGSASLSGGLLAPHQPTCRRIELGRAIRDPLAANADGLLFKVLYHPGRNSPFKQDVLEPADCRRYARWLARNEVKDIDGYRFFYGLFDRAETRAVLGKDLYRWDAGDALDLKHLARSCQAFVTTQPDAESMDLTQRITRYGWDPAPLDHSPYGSDGRPSREWMELERILYEITADRDKVAAQLGELRAAPATLGTLSTINGYVDEVLGRTRLALLLSEPEKAGLRDQLVAERERLASELVDTKVSELSAGMNTLEQLQVAKIETTTLADALNDSRAPSHAADLIVRFTGLSERAAEPLWKAHLAESNASLVALDGAGFEEARRLLALHTHAEALREFLVPERTPTISESFGAFRDAQAALVGAMLQRSSADVVAWIVDMPPSRGAEQALDHFRAAVQQLGARLDGVAEIRAAMAAKAAAYNPDSYARPDIVMSVMREHWTAVGLWGLEDLAYLYSVFRSTRAQCPGELDARSGRFTGLTLELASVATGRIMRGEARSRGEAGRALFLFFNMLNQPGCTVDYMGTVVGCRSQEDFAATQDALMTSIDGELDARRLLANGCSGDLHEFLEGLGRFASTFPSFAPPRPILIPDYFAYRQGSQQARDSGSGCYHGRSSLCVTGR